MLGWPGISKTAKSRSSARKRRGGRMHTMRARIRGIVAVACPVTVVLAITIAATVMLKPSTANAQSVDDDTRLEYVKLCSIYGSGFFVFPGSDACINVATNDARVFTEGGVGRWRVPNNPRTWAPSPEDACRDGQLVKFG